MKLKALGLLILVLASLYFFTDVFPSPTEIFNKELEDYQNSGFTATEFTITHFEKLSIEAVGRGYDVVRKKVSKNDLREKVSTGNFRAMENTDICYDPAKQQIWVYRLEENIVNVYWWTPSATDIIYGLLNR